MTSPGADQRPDAAPTGQPERYKHGYHRVIVGSYTRRTAETCAGFLLPRPGGIP